MSIQVFQNCVAEKERLVKKAHHLTNPIVGKALIEGFLAKLSCEIEKLERYLFIIETFKYISYIVL